MNFCDRLKNYRLELKIENQKDMASLLNVSTAFYNMLESGKRNASKKFLLKLVALSKKPEEYWLYGVTEEKEWVEKRDEFKCLKNAVDQLLEIGLIKKDSDYSDSVMEVLIAAMKADVNHYIIKKSAN
ncbi:helix-turn-helix transcriptional regulator [Clostridium felsineum]|uniref:helix-turn-helix domain-containing protein n=1 Tax=Clostridium felsineum TaxID=36839 RepID=UPI00214D7E7E|nr:helix-turn-helix transcriptional regulator [Clostridium felsineum]MCR3759211.1 helix-turn-helix transcriptional regulator [Clostridium felsineum]